MSPVLSNEAREVARLSDRQLNMAEDPASLPVPDRTASPVPPTGWRRLIAPLRIATTVLVAAYLVHQLQQIGWNEVLRSLPGSPWFYVVFFVNYLSLPLFEVLIYHGLWRIGLKSLPALLRKRVYNESVVEYSGEAYFYLWAKRLPETGDAPIFRVVRDVNILSALAAYGVTFCVLGMVLLRGTPVAGRLDNALIVKAAVVTGVLVAVLLTVAVVLRRQGMTLPMRTCARVSAIHVTRILVSMGLQALQWHLALPAIGIGQWLFFLAVQMTLKLVPLLPNKDLVFAGLAVGLSARIDAPQPAVAGMLVAAAALQPATNLAVYLGSLVPRRRSGAG
jgi:energy-converting hydrogenase Eha subunit A